MEVRSPAALVAAAPGGPGCEVVSEGLLREPVSAVTSAAFLVAASVIVLRAWRPGPDDGAAGTTPTTGAVPLAYAALVAGVGVGSFVQHGPDPAWSDPAHDLPLLATLAYVAADAVADLTGRPPRWWWWAAPVAALLPVVVLAPRAGDLAQVVVAGVAVALTVLRAVARPALRRRLAVALALLSVGGTVGTLSRAGWPWCELTSVWQGHGAWHVLAAAALVVLAPTLRRPTATRSARHAVP